MLPGPAASPDQLLEHGVLVLDHAGEGAGLGSRYCLDIPYTDIRYFVGSV